MCACVCMYVCMYDIRMYVYMMYVCMHVCMYVCMYDKYTHIYLNIVTRSLPDKCYTILEIVLITMSMRVTRSCAIVTAVVTMITQNSVGHRDNTSKTLNLH